MVTAPSTHVHISEREADGTFEDCTWDSGLEFFRDAFDPSKPHTHAEAQALRAASGEPPTGGSNLGDFRKGVAARYRHTLPPAISNRGILTALKPGMVAVVQGSMSAFGPTNPLSKWDRNFDGGHAVWIGRHPDGTLLWCDPEAPTAAAVPIAISSSDVQKFVNAFAGQAIVAPALKWITPPKEEPVEPITQYLPGYTAIINAQSNVRSAPHIAATLLRATATSESIILIGTVKGDVDPGNGKDVWYMWWKNGRYEFTALDNVRDVKAPAGGVVDDGYTKATQDAAVAAQRVADQKTLDEAVAKAAEAEKERIATVVGESSADAIRSV